MVDHFEDDEDGRDAGQQGVRRRFDEFECPSCSAHNPSEEFGNHDEVLCGYCGMSFKALVDETGKLKLREA